MQDLASDCGIAVVKSILLTYGRYDETLLTDRLQHLNIDQGLSLLDIEELLSIFGIYGSNYQVNEFSNLNFKTPCILVTRRDGINHYILGYGKQNDKLVVSNPAEKTISYQSFEEVRDIFNGFAYIVESDDSKVVLKETSATSENDNNSLSFKERLSLFFYDELTLANSLVYYFFYSIFNCFSRPRCKMRCNKKRQAYLIY